MTQDAKARARCARKEAGQKFDQKHPRTSAVAEKKRKAKQKKKSKTTGEEGEEEEEQEEHAHSPIDVDQADLVMKAPLEKSMRTTQPQGLLYLTLL